MDVAIAERAGMGGHFKHSKYSSDNLMGTQILKHTQLNAGSMSELDVSNKHVGH